MAKNSKTLLIVESPAKAKTIQKYLGDDFIVRASYGHIFDLRSGQKDGIGIDLEKGFKLRYCVAKDKKDKVQSIIDASENVEKILLASDMDREGECIAFHLAEIVESAGKPIKRVKFNEITKNGVKKGLENLCDLDPLVYDAQQARRALDRIVGFMASPYLINRIGSNNSAGRVQSVAVKMIVDRDREIENFKPEEYWNIIATLLRNHGEPSFQAKYQGDLKDKDSADKVKKDLEKDTFVISKIDNKEKKKAPFPPFTTASLTASAAGKYRFAAARTMAAAQSLFENGMITYHRTDSVRIDPAAIDECRSWLKENKYDIPKTPNAYKTKEGAQAAHEAIRPTDVSRTPQNAFVSDDERKVYTLIWERFVASQMNPAIYDTVAVFIDSSSKHLLKATGKILRYKGWLEIMEDFDETENDVKLPVLQVKDVLKVVQPGIKAEQKFTQPPAKWNEKSLIEELEKRGIGRPSTYATIMAKITDRNYVERNGNVFTSTDSGKKVVDILAKYFSFMDFKYTAEMEEKLDKIEEGKLKYVDMMSAFYSQFSAELKKAHVIDDTDYGFKCKVCEATLYLKSGVYGFYMAAPCSKEHKSTVSVEMVDGKPVPRLFEEQKIAKDVTCPKCDGAMVEANGKFGPYRKCRNYPKCNGTRKIPIDKKCNKCSSDMHASMFNGQLRAACMAYPKCQNIVELTSAEIKKIDWIDPETLQVKMDSKTKRILKKKVENDKGINS